MLKPLDFCVLVPALVVVVASFVFVYSGGGGSPSVNLRGDGGRWVFPLDASETVVISGPLGDTVIEITGGMARVVSSPCADQVCVVMGAVRNSGQWAACLPNRVMLYISAGGDQGDVDATAW